MKRVRKFTVTSAAAVLTVCCSMRCPGEPVSGLAPYRSQTAERVAQVLPGAVRFDIPVTLYPRAELETRWARLADDELLQATARTACAKADRYLAIPSGAWQELIPDRSTAPQSNEALPGSGGYIHEKKCLICGGVPGGQFEGYDIVDSPFLLRTRCCGLVLHERAEDRTAEETARICGQERFAHLDGAERVLDYAESRVLETTDGSRVRYFPSNWVWHLRMKDIVGYWRGGVLPELRDAYLATGEEKYAEVVIAILERFAEIMPHLPVAYHNGQDARSRDEMLAAASRHEPFHSHGWLGPCRLYAGNANFRPPWEAYGSSMLARAFLAVEHAQAWGAGAAAARRHAAVKRDLFGELSVTMSAYGAKQCVGNGIGLYAPGLLALGVVLQDHYFFDGFIGVLEEFLYNENYHDGITTEGSMNYAGMVGGMYQQFEDAGLKAHPDYMAANPFLCVAGRSQQRISTLLGIQSQHGDGPNSAFMARLPSAAEPRQASDVFGGYGISILRGGGRGQRLEVIFSHDRIVGHAHDNPLGIQLFFRGVPLLAHMGDSRLSNFIDLRSERNPHAAAIKALPYPRPMVESDMERQSFGMALAQSAFTKNTVLVDEYGHQERGLTPWRGGWGGAGFPYFNLRLFKGAADPDGPAALLQVAEATGENMLAYHYQGLDTYRRTLLVVSRPGGRPYAVDIFRVAGGNRQTLIYGSRGTEVDSTIPAAPTSYTRLQDWLAAAFPTRIEWNPVVTDAVSDYTLLANIAPVRAVPASWQHTWRLDYAAWAPKTRLGEDGRLDAEQWRSKGLVPVYLRVHGVAPAVARQDWILRATSNLPASIDEWCGQTRQRGMVEFEDAVQYVGEVRTSPYRLATTHVHLLEPWADGAEPAVRAVARLKPNEGSFTAGAVGLRVELTDDSCDLIAYLPPGAGQTVFEGGLSSDGRCALLRLDPDGGVTAARLIGGTRLCYGGVDVLTMAAPGLNGQVVGVEGDLSGDRSVSALILTTAGPTPETDALSGQVLSVGLNRGRRVENYVVQAVTALDDGRLRVELQGAPTFVDYFGKVLQLPGDDTLARYPQRAGSFVGTQNAKGLWTPYLHGSRLAFPTLGLEFTLERTEPCVGKGQRFDLAEDVDLRRAGVKQETWFAVYPDWRGANARVVLEAVR